jgi:uncharacterized protein
MFDVLKKAFLMKIFLHELTDQETELRFNQDEGWVLAAVERVDERLDDLVRPTSPTAKAPRPRSIDVQFSLRKVDDVAVLSGRVKTHINLLCSRCAAPFKLEASLKFSSLFCKDPAMAGIGHLEDTQEGGTKRVGQNKGYARHAHDYSADDTDKSGETGQDLDITYLSQDFLELGDVLTEQLQLQVPFQPLCKETCKGICTQCGTDLNAGRCACSKVVKQTPFSVLKNLKL